MNKCTSNSFKNNNNNSINTLSSILLNNLIKLIILQTNKWIHSSSNNNSILNSINNNNNKTLHLWWTLTEWVLDKCKLWWLKWCKTLILNPNNKCNWCSNYNRWCLWCKTWCPRISNRIKQCNLLTLTPNSSNINNNPTHMKLRCRVPKIIDSKTSFNQLLVNHRRYINLKFLNSNQECKHRHLIHLEMVQAPKWTLLSPNISSNSLIVSNRMEVTREVLIYLIERIRHLSEHGKGNRLVVIIK